MKAADPVLGKLIARLGPCRLAPQQGQETFDALLEAIVYQQLNGKAAATIHGRVLALFSSGKPTPREVLRADPAKLRGAGLSANKLAAIRDLAARTASGGVPCYKLARTLSDEDLIARLTQVRGIGVWTAHMFLIFRLGRPDVLPTGDFAIRKAFGLAFGKRGHPKPEAVERHARKWAPYRTVASWYLWRSLDAQIR